MHFFQIDAISLYLLVLAEMTASGLQIIYTLDEVAIGLIFSLKFNWSTRLKLIWVLSQAETKITVVWPFGKTEQLKKIATIFTQNDNYFQLGLFRVKIVVIFPICLLLSRGFTKRSHNSDYRLSPDSGLKSESSKSI